MRQATELLSSSLPAIGGTLQGFVILLRNVEPLRGSENTSFIYSPDFIRGYPHSAPWGLTLYSPLSKPLINIRISDKRRLCRSNSPLGALGVQFHRIHILYPLKICPEDHPFAIRTEMHIWLQFVLVMFHIYQFGRNKMISFGFE